MRETIHIVLTLDVVVGAFREVSSAGRESIECHSPNTMASKDQEPCTNFLRQFRDKNSRQFKKFTATQFMEVWTHYDADGELFN